MKNDSMATNSNIPKNLWLVFAFERILWVCVRHTHAEKWWKWEIKNHLDFQDVETIRIKSDKKEEKERENKQQREQNKKNDM